MSTIKTNIWIQIKILLSLIILSQLTKTNTDYHENSTSNSLPIFVSLGRDCEPAKMLKTLNLRTEAYPFDWNITTQFSKICNIIENNFKDFLNPLFLEHNGLTILHTYYAIEFRHDFPSPTPYGNTDVVDFDASWQQSPNIVVDNFLDFLPIITEKYTRRINRFIKLLNSTENIIFIRTHLMPQEANQFVTLMATYYPNLKYQLIGLQYDKSIELEFQQIPFVKIYYPQTKHEHISGWTQSEEWFEIIKKFDFK